MARRAATGLTAALLLVACGRIGFDRAGPGADSEAPLDLREQPDAAVDRDALAPRDLIAPVDVASSPDLVSVTDGAIPPDLGAPIDASVVDLVVLPTCSDGVRNGDETDADCGGSCARRCAAGAGCADDGDCLSAVCSAGLCQPPSCSDGRVNGDETDLDCGGGCPRRCAIGKACRIGSDCVSQVCANKACAAPTCNDAVRNGAESDIDCGGACPRCLAGRGCGGDADCQSAVCTAGVCVGASCSDGRKNALETDVDCGGAACPKCAAGKACLSGNDCASGRCPSGQCAALLLADDFQDGVLSPEWNYWLMKWVEQDGWLTAVGEARPGFNYGHWGNGRAPKTATHVGDKTWTNYRVEMVVEALAPGALNPYAVAACCRGATIHFRCQESVESWNAPANTYYSLHFQTRDCPDGGGGWWSQRGAWSLGRIHGSYMMGTGCCSGAQGSGRSLGAGSSPDILDGANQIAIEAAGDVVKVWVNGTLLIDVKDVYGYDAGAAPITYGGIGVTGHWENLVRIDNVRVTTLP